MFGGTSIFRPTTNPMAPNPVSQPYAPQPYGPLNNMINIEGKDIPAFWGEHFKQAIDGFHQLEWDLNLQNLMTLVKLEQERALEIMDKAKEVDFSNKKWDAQSSK